jgi:DNA-binding transcriptional ArsR family regulator
LGDQRRLEIVRRLCQRGPASITSLTAGAGVTRQAITKHLHVLAGTGLVRCSRRGRESYWELEPHKLTEARRYLEEISAQWDDALARLRTFVEN